MKISLTLRCLKMPIIHSNRVCLLKTKIDNFCLIQSAEQKVTEGVCYFLQENVLTIKQSEPNHIFFDLLVDGIIVAHGSMFYHQAVHKKQIRLTPTRQIYTESYTLSYNLEDLSLTMKNIDKQNLLKKNSLPQESFGLNEQERLRILQLGLTTYQFTKILDPLVKATKLIQYLLGWKSPLITIFIGIILSTLILYPKLSMLMLCVFFILGQNLISRKILSAIPTSNYSQRILPPDQNLNFLKDLMKIYCQIFQNVYQFLKEEDRTKIIIGIQIIWKSGFVIITILIFLSIDTLFVITIWLVLFLTSDTGRKSLRYLLPVIFSFSQNVDHIILQVTNSLAGKVLYSHLIFASEGLVKQFYIYQYQRWWFGVNWVNQNYSDQNNQRKLHARMETPAGWKWIEGWKIDVSDNTDKEGFEYSNDFLKGWFKPENKMILHIIRRRKWSRRCVRQENKQITVKKSGSRIQIASPQNIKVIKSS